MLKAEDAGFRYGDASGDAVSGISCGIMAGERVAVLGLNGSGKSTLARLLAGGLDPLTGTVTCDGVPLATKHPDPHVGFVGQDPLAQFVSSTVAEEAAFAPRSLMLEPDEVMRRADEALAECGLSELAGRNVFELSGGQQQRLALAGALSLYPRYLVLDEVCSQLDDGARRKARSLISGLQEKGMGLFEVTHSFRDAVGASRVLVLDAGRIAWRGLPSDLVASEEALGLAGLQDDPLVAIARLMIAQGYRLGRAVDVADIARYVRLLGLEEPVLDVLDRHDASGERASGSITAAPAVLSARQVRKRYDGRAALSDVSLDVHAGEVCLVCGTTGSGKSTLARILAGVLDPDGGEVLLAGERVAPGKVGLAFQRPENQLFCDTVEDDVAYGPRNLGLGEEEVASRVRMSMEALGLDASLADKSPFALSGGQRRRVALAGVVALHPDAYVFDEPTAGLDGEARDFLHRLVRRLAEQGAAIVVVSHDVEEWLPWSDTACLLNSGELVARGNACDLATQSAPFERAGLEAPFCTRLREQLRA